MAVRITPESLLEGGLQIQGNRIADWKTFKMNMHRVGLRPLKEPKEYLMKTISVALMFLSLLSAFYTLCFIISPENFMLAGFPENFDLIASSVTLSCIVVDAGCWSGYVLLRRHRKKQILDRQGAEDVLTRLKHDLENKLKNSYNQLEKETDPVRRERLEQEQAKLSAQIESICLPQIHDELIL